LRSRRVRAILAGGLVLGVGAAATLAAWNDSEYAASTFTAGTFGITGSIDGATFVDYTTKNPQTPASLNFQLPPTAMAPGNTTYALFSVKTVSQSVAGNLLLSAGVPGGTGLAAHLTYGVRTVSTAVCNEATYGTGTVVVAAGSALTAGPSGAQPVAANGAAQVNYCFAVTLPTTAPNAAQSLTMTQTWQILGTSS
jgi:predicted ribosomally synthesized peptide with SipW-like signal peptide